jgi:hypothetical protein
MRDVSGGEVSLLTSALVTCHHSWVLASFIFILGPSLWFGQMSSFVGSCLLLWVVVFNFWLVKQAVSSGRGTVAEWGCSPFPSRVVNMHGRTTTDIVKVTSGERGELLSATWQPNDDQYSLFIVIRPTSTVSPPPPMTATSHNYPSTATTTTTTTTTTGQHHINSQTTDDDNLACPLLQTVMTDVVVTAHITTVCTFN